MHVGRPNEGASPFINFDEQMLFIKESNEILNFNKLCAELFTKTESILSVVNFTILLMMSR